MSMQRFMQPYRLLSISIAGILLLISLAVSADNTQQQDLFLKVEKSLKRGNDQQYQKYRDSLSKYPLVNYLDYLHLGNQLNVIGQKGVNQFAAKHSDLPQASQLQYQWLTWLAKKKRWKDYLQAYESFEPKGSRYQCLKGVAFHKLGKKQQAWQEAEKLWLVGKSQNKACDSLFSGWRKAGMLTQSLVVSRFWMAVEEGNTSLARYIDRKISQAKYKESTKLFWRIHKQPKLLTSSSKLDGSLEHHRLIMLHGIKRLISKDKDQALDVWLNLKGQYPFEPRQVAQIDRRLAMKFAKNFADNAEAQIARIDPNYQNTEITEWRTRLALANQDWQQVLDLIQELPESDQGSNRWLYWQSVANLKLNGYPRSANLIQQRQRLAKDKTLNEVRQGRSFYGFMVADLSRKPFQMNHEDASYRVSDLDKIEAKFGGFKRIKEWLNLGRTYMAQSEMNRIAPKLTANERKLLPYLAQRMEWHHQAIMSAAQESLWNDLELRFPAPQSGLFSKYAQKRDIDYPWALSIARQESAFNPMARSHAGARGLMQLMPATAKYTAKQSRIRYKRVSELYKPETNIALGTAHLAWLADRFEENKVFATAAYNAGSTAVRRWLKDRGHLPLDIWIETIPYDETRNYVQNVLAFRVIYGKKDSESVRMFSPKEASALSLAPTQATYIVQKES